MDCLDLHGVRHERVQRLVEDFVLTCNLPARIITGNSPTMKHLVHGILKQHHLKWDYENDYNLGSLIVKENG